MGSMKQIGDIWGREVLKFCLWTLIAALVCFLLYRILVNNTTQHLVPLSHVERDRLMTVALPASLADTLLRYEAFDVHFNPERGIANCAAYELTQGELHGDVPRGDFMPDAHVTGCALPTDYAGSGLERGHLVPAGDLKWSEKAMRQSFLMTNICPMAKGLNEGGWAKLEEKVREWVRRDSALLVFAGPIVSDGDSTLARGKMAVPSRYFKVVMAPCVRPVRAIAFIYPNGNSAGRLDKYAVSVDEVEHQTGLDFFPDLHTSEQHRVESTVNLDAWLN